MLIAGMPLFDAITTAFATAGTGGFATTANGMAGYSTLLQVIVTVFMLLYSVNFNSYYLLGKKRWKEALNTEVKVFFVIVFSAIALITANLCIAKQYTFLEALQHVAFSVSSVISTTGFATEDFNLWPTFSKTILVLLMFVGACAGSTGGGMKVSRWMMLSKGATHEVKRILHPKQVKKITMDKKVVEHEVVRSINAYFIAFILIFLVSLLLITFDCSDTETSFTSVVTMMNNVGPGLGKFVGPVGSFASFSNFSKLVLTIEMIAGRLELFPILLLFSPNIWRKRN
jgi:trk system potassium uptake protein TrkH